MEQTITDIVVTTCNRLSYLKQTLGHIWERTRSPYKLHVIDDASEEGNVEWLLERWREGKIEDLLLRGESHGHVPNLSVAIWMTFSDPFVITDDDVLCPDVEPDWLTRGIRAMQAYPRLRILALNHPGALRRNYEHLQHPEDEDDRVVYCQVVGHTLMFVRRGFAEANPLPKRRQDFGTTADLIRCGMAREQGYAVGYLRRVYCHHIGLRSALTGGTYGRMVEPVNPKTFAPPEQWRE